LLIHYYYFVKRRASSAKLNAMPLLGAGAMIWMILCLLSSRREASGLFEAAYLRQS